MSLFTTAAHAMVVDTAQVLWRRHGPFANYIEVRSSISPSGTRILYYELAGRSSFMLLANMNTGLPYVDNYLSVDQGIGTSDIVRIEMTSDTTYMVVSTSSIFVVNAKTAKIIDEHGPENILSVPITCAVPAYDFNTWFLGSSDGLYRYNYDSRRVDTLSYNPNYYEPDSTVIGHPIGVQWIGLSTDERTVYSAGMIQRYSGVPGRLCAWNAVTGRQIYQVNEPLGMTFLYMSPFVHGEQVAIADDFYVWVADLRTGTFPREFPVSSEHRTGVGMSRDASVLAVASYDSLDFFLSATGERIARLKLMQAAAMDFLPNRSNDLLIMSPLDQAFLRARFAVPTSVADGTTTMASRHYVAPNPAYGSACVHLVVEEDAEAFVRLVTVDGRVIEDRGLGVLARGTHTECLDAPSGIYQCIITVGTQRRTFGVVIL